MADKKEETMGLDDSPKSATSTSASDEGSPSKTASEVESDPKLPIKPPRIPGSDDEDEEEISLGAAVAGFSSWFSSTLSSAKEKSSEMLQYLKQDISEFSDVVTEASRDLNEKLKLQETAKAVAETVGKQASVVLDQMSTVFGVGPDDDDEAIVMNSGGGPVIFDRVKAKIYSLAVEEEVFLKDPVDSKSYDNWLLTFDLEKKSEEMNELLTANPHLQLHYGRLVPDKVSHLVFWHRFYFRVHEICLAEEQKERKRKAESKRDGSGDGKDEHSDIEKDNPSPTGTDQSLVDLSEEDQKRLLAEYEEEMKNSSAQHSRRSSGTHLSSSSSGSFAMVTHDATTDEIKVE